MKFPLVPGICLLGAALVAGCAPTMRSHGYTPVPEALERIEVGVDTRSSVQRKIGRPSSTGVFTDDGWYYVSSTIEHFAFYEPRVVDRKVIAITFDAEDRVASLNSYGLQDGRLVDLATATTPTFGQQLTVVEQIISNLGNVTGTEIFGDE